MSQENVEVVRRAIAASVSESPDADTLADLMHPDHVLTTDWGVETTTYHGIPAYLASIVETNAPWQSWQQATERILDAGEKGVVLFMRLVAVGRESGAPVQTPWAMVVTLRDGKIASSQAYLDRDAALKVVGLEE